MRSDWTVSLIPVVFTPTRSCGWAGRRSIRDRLRRNVTEAAFIPVKTFMSYCLSPHVTFTLPLTLQTMLCLHVGVGAETRQTVHVHRRVHCRPAQESRVSFIWERVRVCQMIPHLERSRQLESGCCHKLLTLVSPFCDSSLVLWSVVTGLRLLSWELEPFPSSYLVVSRWFQPPPPNNSNLFTSFLALDFRDLLGAQHQQAVLEAPHLTYGGGARATGLHLAPVGKYEGSAFLTLLLLCDCWRPVKKPTSGSFSSSSSSVPAEHKHVVTTRTSETDSVTWLTVTRPPREKGSGLTGWTSSLAFCFFSLICCCSSL